MIATVSHVLISTIIAIVLVITGGATPAWAACDPLLMSDQPTKCVFR